MAPRNGVFLPSTVQKKADIVSQWPMSQAGRPVRGRTDNLNPDALPYLQTDGSWLAASDARNPAKALHASLGREAYGRAPLTPMQAAVHAALWETPSPLAPPVPPKIPLDSAPGQSMAHVSVGLARPTAAAQRQEGPPHGPHTEMSTKPSANRTDPGPLAPTESRARPGSLLTTASPPPTAWTSFKRSVRNYLSEAWEEARPSGRQRGADEGYGNAGGGEERDDDGRWVRR